MLPKTMFPTLRIAKALDVKVKVVKLSDRENRVLSIRGRTIGSVVTFPHGAPSDVEVAAGDCATFAKAFRDLGYSNPQEHLVPEPFRTAEMYVQSISTDILNEVKTLKAIKRRAKTHTIWVCRDCKPGEYFDFKAPFCEEMRQATKVANPAQTILFFVNDDIADL